MKSHQILAAMLGGMLGVFAVMLGLFLVLRARSVPELDAAKFADAERRWQATAPVNYTIETKVSGLQPATYRVEVDSGQVKSAWRDGHALKDRRTLGTWSVPGMFGTIERDLDTNSGALDNNTPLHLRADFDEQFGYPRRYVRLAWGTKITTSWEVIHFEAFDESPGDE